MLIILSTSSLPLLSQITSDTLYSDTLQHLDPKPDLEVVDSLASNLLLTDTLTNDSLDLNSITDNQDSLATSDDFLDNEVLYNAIDSMLFDLSTNEVHLYGEAYVKYGDITLTAENIVYDFDSYLVYAEGGVDSVGNPKNLPIFKQGKEEFEATQINYNFETEKGYIKEVYSQADQAYVFAKVSKKQPNNNVHIKGGSFSTCENPNPHYSFRSPKMIVIPNDKVITGPGYVAVGNVPLPIGLPFIMFPTKTDKASGIVIPKYGDSDKQGFFLRDGGFYLALNDYFHTEFLGTIYTNGSWGVKNNSAYKKRYKFGGNFTIDYQNFIFGDRSIEGNFTESKSFTVRWTHRQDAKASKNSTFNTSVNFVSGSGYRNDIGSSSSDYVNRNFNSNIAYSLRIPNTPFSLTANGKLTQRVDITDIDPDNDIQTTSTTNEITLPQVTFNMKRTDIPMAWIKKNKSSKKRWYEKVGFTYTMNLENRIKYSPQQLDTINLNSDNFKTYIDLRNGIKHRINMSTSFKIKTLSISPFINTNGSMYSQQIEKFIDPETQESFTDTISGFSSVWGVNTGVNLTTKLYGMYAFKGDGFIKAMRHQITFSAGVTFDPGNPTNLFGYVDEGGTFDNYSPYEGAIFSPPSSTPSNIYNFRIINDLESKVKSKKDSTTTYNKVKFIDNLSTGVRYDAFRDSIKWSDVTLSGRFTKIANVVTINYNAAFDPYAYNSDNRKIASSYFEQTGNLIRLKSAGVVAAFKIKSKNQGKKAKPKNAAEQQIEKLEEEKIENDETGFFENLSVPWTLDINYNMNMTKPVIINELGQFTDTTRFIQTLSLGANFTLFKIFRFGVKTGYDFLNKEVQPSRLSLYVDLHCWEFSVSLRPNGRQKSYSVSFNIKSSLLKDLKIKKEDTYGGGGGFF